MLFRSSNHHSPRRLSSQPPQLIPQPVRALIRVSLAEVDGIGGMQRIQGTMGCLFCTYSSPPLWQGLQPCCCVLIKKDESVSPSADPMTTQQAADLIESALDHCRHQNKVLKAAHRYGDSKALLAEFQEWRLPIGDDIELMICPEDQSDAF